VRLRRSFNFRASSRISSGVPDFAELFVRSRVTAGDAPGFGVMLMGVAGAEGAGDGSIGGGVGAVGD
jgi:hypothetical protein